MSVGLPRAAAREPRRTRRPVGRLGGARARGGRPHSAPTSPSAPERPSRSAGRAQRRRRPGARRVSGAHRGEPRSGWRPSPAATSSTCCGCCRRLELGRPGRVDRRPAGGWRRRRRSRAGHLTPLSEPAAGRATPLPGLPPSRPPLRRGGVHTTTETSPGLRPAQLRRRSGGPRARRCGPEASRPRARWPGSRGQHSWSAWRRAANQAPLLPRPASTGGLRLALEPAAHRPAPACGAVDGLTHVGHARGPRRSRRLIPNGVTRHPGGRLDQALDEVGGQVAASPPPPPWRRRPACGTPPPSSRRTSVSRSAVSHRRTATHRWSTPGAGTAIPRAARRGPPARRLDGRGVSRTVPGDRHRDSRRTGRAPPRAGRGLRRLRGAPAQPARPVGAHGARVRHRCGRAAGPPGPPRRGAGPTSSTSPRCQLAGPGPDPWPQSGHNRAARRLGPFFTGWLRRAGLTPEDVGLRLVSPKARRTLPDVLAPEQAARSSTPPPAPRSRSASATPSCSSCSTPAASGSASSSGSMSTTSTAAAGAAGAGEGTQGAQRPLRPARPSRRSTRWLTRGRPRWRHRTAVRRCCSAPAGAGSTPGGAAHVHRAWPQARGS